MDPSHSTSSQFITEFITEVPGSFTRQAYEGAIAPEIAALVTQRQEQVGWVLAEPSDGCPSTCSLKLLLYTVGIHFVAAVQVFGQFLCG